MLLKKISQKLGLSPMMSTNVMKNTFSTINTETPKKEIIIGERPAKKEYDPFTARAIADWEPKVPKHTIKIDTISYRQPHPVWDLSDSEKVEFTHYPPKKLADRYALAIIKFCRWSFDKATFYNKNNMNESKYLTRAIFLETIAAIPGMVGGMHRHLKSLRTLQPDGGWIHHLLEEAENERMHLLTFLQIKQPGLLLRLWIMSAQFVFTAFYAIHYVLAPNTAHRLVGYLEEEAVLTYTNMIKDIDRGQLPKWAKLKVANDPKRYWELPENAKMRELILAIRADEVNHREFNHHFADIKLDDPFPEHKKIEFLIMKGKEKEIV